MLNRKALFSIFTVAAFAVAAALTANSASAAPPKGPGVIKGNGGGGGGGGAWKGPKGPGNFKANPGKGGGGGAWKGPKGGPKWGGPKWGGPKFGFKPSWCFKHPWRCRGHVHVVRYPVVTGVATAAIARPAAGPCTCLTKTYLPTGAVMFKDVCTQEVAVNPPEQQAAVQ
jgi:hypothetical protein